MNGLNKIVFSWSLDQAPWGKWAEARVVKTSAVEEAAKLKQQPGKDIVLWGSLSLAQALMREGLIDEYQLRVCPAVMGEGRSLFPKNMGLQNLRLTDSKPYKSGLVWLTYQPRR